MEGELNPESYLADWFPNSSLIASCLLAMGFTTAGIPTTVDASPAPANLQWLGAHPMEELAKILEHCGHVFCPNKSGGEGGQVGMIQKLGVGAEPTIPSGRELPELELPAFSRQGKTVVITSAPNAVIDSYDENSPTTPTWNFIAFDTTGNFVNLSALSSEIPDPIAAVRAKFSGVTDATRAELLNAHCYRYLQLDPVNYPPNHVHVLRKHWIKDDDTDLTVVCTRACLSPGGTWSNHFSAYLFLDWFSGDQNVIHTPYRVGKTDSDGVTDLDAHFAAVTDLKVRFSVEAYDRLGTGLKKFFNVGWTVEDDGSLTQLTDAACTAVMMSGGDDQTIILPMPELRYIRPGGQDDTDLLNSLTARAKQVAEQMLAGSATPIKTTVGVGFIPAKINGVVSQIIYSQTGCLTTFKLNSWYRPDFCPRKDEMERWFKTGNFPGQHATESTRQAMGSTGSVQPAVPMLPPPAASGGGGSGNSNGALQLVLPLGGADSNGLRSCTTWDRDTQTRGSETFYVKSYHSGGIQPLYAMQVKGGVDAVVGSIRVTWTEVVVAGNRDGYTVYPGVAASAAVVGVTPFGGTIEGTDTAKTDTWAVSDFFFPIDEYFVYRMVYDDAGSQVLRAYVRKIQRDTNGILYSISVENAVNVDTPTNCS